MAFKLGNHSINEILFGVAQNFEDELLYSLDQLSSASITISAESSDITDKKGNLVRRIYKSKSGEFSATNAFLHPAVLNAASGSAIESATEEALIQMPKIFVINAGTEVDASDAKEGTVHVMGLYGNGANGAVLAPSATTAEVDKTFKFADGKITVPGAAEDAPTTYLVKYERDVESGIKLSNLADKFPDTVHMTFLCSYVDPCDDQLKPCYVYVPSFMPDPAITINLDADNQSMDFAGTLQMDYCAGTNKTLYIIYYPDEDIIETAEGDDSNP